MSILQHVSTNTSLITPSRSHSTSTFDKKVFLLFLPALVLLCLLGTLIKTSNDKIHIIALNELHIHTSAAYFYDKYPSTSKTLSQSSDVTEPLTDLADIQYFGGT